MSIKPPPHETEIEKSVLASMFLNPDSRADAIETLIDMDFHHTNHRVLFSTIKDLNESGSPVGIDTVWAALSDEQKEKLPGASYLCSMLDDTPPSVDIKYHISILKGCRAKRRIIELTNSINKRVYKNNGDLIKIANDAQHIIDEIKKAQSIRESTFKFIHNARIVENLKPVEWRIHGIMEDNQFYYNYGDAGSYKTFIELDRGLCIAAGIDYHGHPVKQGTVFYIAGEGQQGIGRRIAAWLIHHGIKAQDVPFFVAKTPTQLMDPGAVDEVRRAVDALSKEYGPPAVLHIDTLARNFGEGDENATKDMNRVISNLDIAFGNDFGRGLTHHSGHANKDRARGSYALHCAADAAFRVQYDSVEGKVLVTGQKAKDAPIAAPMLFGRREIKMTIGSQHDSSFVLELEAEGDDVCITPETQESGLSQNQKKALAVLKDLYRQYEKNLADSGRAGQMPNVSISDWREACLAQNVYSRRSTFDRGANSLLHRGCTVTDESGYYAYTIEIYRKYKECNL